MSVRANDACKIMCFIAMIAIGCDGQSNNERSSGTTRAPTFDEPPGIISLYADGMPEGPTAINARGVCFNKQKDYVLCKCRLAQDVVEMKSAWLPHADKEQLGEIYYGLLCGDRLVHAGVWYSVNELTRDFGRSDDPPNQRSSSSSVELERLAPLLIPEGASNYSGRYAVPVPRWIDTDDYFLACKRDEFVVCSLFSGLRFELKPKDLEDVRSRSAPLELRVSHDGSAGAMGFNGVPYVGLEVRGNSIKFRLARIVEPDPDKQIVGHLEFERLGK